MELENAMAESIANGSGAVSISTSPPQSRSFPSPPPPAHTISPPVSRHDDELSSQEKHDSLVRLKNVYSLPCSIDPSFSYSPSSLTLNQCCAPAAQLSPVTSSKMAFTKTQRICTLLVIDVCFFLLEIIVGYRVHSLALVADAFHMLNDVISLLVGLWAVRIANSGKSSKMYTYGWQRAETLGALVNGVFLVALCLSIFLDAIQRFFEPQIVSNPEIVLIVGCLGLASNVLGLFLFHDHSHSHGEHEDHDHAHAAEEGQSQGLLDDPETEEIRNENGNIEGVLPEVQVGGFKKASTREFTRSDEEGTTISGRSSEPPVRKSSQPEVHGRAHRRKTSGSFSRGFGSVDNLHVHPASFRADIIQASRVEERDSEEEEEAVEEENASPDERSRLTNGDSKKGTYGSVKNSPNYEHHTHNHNKPKDSEAGGHSHGGHSHGDLNMRGVFLHVLGDAMGNIGVIATALLIWLTTFKGRYYFDPAISLVITCIILTSAIPLCLAASRILLQAVPVGMEIEEIRADIQSLPLVDEAHHLHVWQLSSTKLVASLHVKVKCEIQGTGSAEYMQLAHEIRACLRGYGIYSSTIQPEFLPSPEAIESGKVSKSASVNADNECMMEGNQCCD